MAMHVVEVLLGRRDRLHLRLVLQPPARVVHHPYDDPVTGPVLVEPGVVDEGMEPRPYTARGRRRASSSNRFHSIGASS